MTQEHLITAFFRADLIADITAVILFILVYSVLAPWWRNPLGRALVLLDILIGLALLPSVLSLFWSFNRLTSLIAGWYDVGTFGAIALVLLLRIPLWIRLHRRQEPDDEQPA